jgi:23S rRNA (guanosine2251-2'-O)-methyltransferase
MAAKHFLTWGIHSVQVALTYAAEGVLELWLKEGEISSDLASIQSLANDAGVATQTVPLKTLERLTDGSVHQGVVLRRRMPSGLILEDYLARVSSAKSPPLLLVLDQVQDPQNFGACLRVADGAGADAMLVSRDHCAQITGTVAKAASGALDSVPIIAVGNLARALEQLRAAGLWLAGTVQDVPATIYDCDFNLPLAVVLGSEANGLRRLTREKCDHLVRIPMAGRLSSLNVATATAITLFEVNRQRLRVAG